MFLCVSFIHADRQTDRQGVVITKARLEITVYSPGESTVVTEELVRLLETVTVLFLAHACDQ